MLQIATACEKLPFLINYYNQSLTNNNDNNSNNYKNNNYSYYLLFSRCKLTYGYDQYMHFYIFLSFNLGMDFYYPAMNPLSLP